VCVGTLFFERVWERFGTHVSDNTVPPMHVGAVYFGYMCVIMF
jgi:hypothetical protein